jgi:hypothetical protein
MKTNYVISDEEHKKRERAEKLLGIQPFMWGEVFRQEYKGREELVSEESREREAMAIRVYNALIPETEKAIISYEISLVKVLQGKVRLKFNSQIKECRICGRSNSGAYDICPVCLDAYHRNRLQILDRLSDSNLLKLAET